MTVTSAEMNGIVSTLAAAVKTALASSTTTSLPSPVSRSGRASNPSPNATADASRFARSRIPAVGHHRPRTRLNERPSALNPRASSSRSAGIATAHAAYSQTPGTMHAANASRSSTAWITVSQTSGPSRRYPKRNDPRQSVSVPRYASLTALRHAASASVAEITLITSRSRKAAKPGQPSPVVVVVVPVLAVVLFGNDSVIRMLTTWTGTTTIATAASIVANLFR